MVKSTKVHAVDMLESLSLVLRTLGKVHFVSIFCGDLTFFIDIVKVKSGNHHLSIQPPRSPSPC
jgi:hypothetical protein